MAPPVGQIRPLRYLAIFGLITAALYALVFGPVWFGDDKPTPKLGIDLQGGTRVTLTARTPDGAVPPKESLNQARQIIETRVNGIGVTGTEVVLDGSNIVITVPGDQGDQAKNLGKTAKLGFREVQNIDQTALQQAQQLAGQLQAQRDGTQPGQPGDPAQPPGSSTPPASPTSSPPASAGAPSSTAPSGQGRPAPALAQEQPPTTPVAPPAGDGTAQPTPDQQACITAASADPSSKDDQEIAKVIAATKTCRQSDALATDPNAQTAALAVALLQCGPQKIKGDPLQGNDDPEKPLVTCGKDGQPYLLGKVFLPGTEVSDATSSADPDNPGHFQINVNFKSGGGQIWADYTAANVGKQTAFVLDSEVLSAPTVQGPIPGGSTRVTGNFTQAEAKDLSNNLKYGSLPLSFSTSDATTVSATLGLASLEAGLIAGAIGLALVFVYCLIYYRLLGVLTIVSLALSGVLVYAVLVLLGRAAGLTLDLAGIAGFIVAIGITADSFVVFFETTQGRSARGADVPLGSAEGLDPRPAHDPVRGRGHVPRRRRSLGARRRPGQGLRVHPGHVHGAGPGRGVPRDAPAGGTGHEVQDPLQPEVLRARVGPEGRRRPARGFAPRCRHRCREGGVTWLTTRTRTTSRAT